MQRLSLMHPKPEVSTWPIPQHEIVKKACGANGTGQFDFFLLTGLGGFRLLVNGNTKKNKNVGLMPRKRKGDDWRSHLSAGIYSHSQNPGEKEEWHYHRRAKMHLYLAGCHT